MSVLSVRDLHVAYSTQAGPVPAVRGVSFDIDKGEVVGLAGESGCGKSTIVNAILRLLPADTAVTGEVMLSDEDVLTDEAGSPPRGPVDRAPRSSSRAPCTRSTPCSGSATSSPRRS